MLLELSGIVESPLAALEESLRSSSKGFLLFRFLFLFSAAAGFFTLEAAAEEDDDDVAGRGRFFLLLLCGGGITGGLMCCEVEGAANTGCWGGSMLMSPLASKGCKSPGGIRRLVAFEVDTPAARGC